MVSFPSPLWYSSRLNLWVGIANKGGASADPHNGIVWSPAPDQAWTYGYTSAADPPAVPADDFVAITEVGGLLYMVGTRVTATSPLSQEALIAASSDGKGWGATIPVLPEVPSFMSATIFAIIGAPDDIGIGIGLRNTNALDVLTNAYSADGGVTLTNQHLGGHFQQIIPFATTPTPAGDLIGFTFNEEQGVTAWHRHPMVGGVRAIACIPNPSKSQDDLWMIVQRSINGVTKQYVEYMAPHFVTGDDLATDAFYSDSGTTYNGAATQTITGLGYLEGQTVKVLTDGALHPDCVVTGGQISLQWPAKIVQIGLPQLARLTTMPIEAGATTGSAAGKVKRITDLTVRFQNTLGGKIGREDPDKELSDPPESIFDNVEMRDPDDPMSQALTVYNGLWPEETYAFNFPAGYEVEGRITMLNDEPYPMTVVGIYPNLDSED
jgi:hypothetical protein